MALVQGHPFFIPATSVKSSVFTDNTLIYSVLSVEMPVPTEKPCVNRNLSVRHRCFPDKMAFNEASVRETLRLPNGAAPMVNLKFHLVLNIRLNTGLCA